MDPVIAALKQLLSQFGEQQHYCVAYSGGIDSQVLLHALVKGAGLSKMVNGRPDTFIRAIHIHHGLQSHADGWAEFSAAQAKALNVPLHIQHVNAKAAKGQSPEAAAREARYAAFSTLLNESEILLTAHNQNDQAETVLLQLLRGAGVKGLSAMPSQTEFSKGLLIRPLLQVSRADITKYAIENKLSWIEDPSNENTQFDRNFLRQKVFPLLSERWPSCTQTLARSAQHCAEASSLIDEVAEQDLGGKVSDLCLTHSLKGGPQGADPSNSAVVNNRLREIHRSPLSISILAHLSQARAREVLRYWLAEQGIALPSTVQLEVLFKDLIEAAEDKNPLVQWPGVELRRFKGAIYAMQPLEPFDSTQELNWDGQSSLVLPGTLGILKPDDPRLLPIQSALSKASSIKICFRQGGEKMRLPGRQGTHELKKLFQEWQVLPWLRDRIPLIYIDEELSLILLSGEGGVMKVGSSLES